MEQGEDFFPSLMQEYCYAFFKIGTPHCFDAFKELSEKMLAYYPGNTVYMTNLGSYYLVYKHDSKTALKMYNKVLKRVRTTTPPSRTVSFSPAAAGTPNWRGNISRC